MATRTRAWHWFEADWLYGQIDRHTREAGKEFPATAYQMALFHATMAIGATETEIEAERERRAAGGL